MVGEKGRKLNKGQFLLNGEGKIQMKWKKELCKYVFVERCFTAFTFCSFDSSSLLACVCEHGAYDMGDKDDRVSDKPWFWYLVMDEV